MFSNPLTSNLTNEINNINFPQIFTSVSVANFGEIKETIVARMAKIIVVNVIKNHFIYEIIINKNPNLYKINPEFLDKHSFIELDFKNQSDFDSHLKNNNYDGIFTKIGLSLNKLNLNFQKSLNFVASPTTGLNHIDENYCLEKSIEILSLKDELNFLRTITTTAEHAWMLMLMCGRSPRKMLDNTSNFNWDRKGLEIIQFRKYSITKRFK